ncbi:MAG: alpha/beta hydrolase, partial [Nocardioides sp.]
GPTIVLCNGLGTSPFCWPALLAPDCGVRVVSWNHRGVGGSERPADPRHVEIENFVEDGLSVMDHFGIESAVLMGWSMGVNTMFELAARYPERVRGLFAVAGVPGDTFATMLAPLRVPHLVARTLTVNASRVMSVAGKALSPFARRVPVGPALIGVLSHSGFMFPLRDPELAELAVKEFLSTPLDWYFQLALSTSRHARVRLSTIQVPAMFVAASFDILAGARDMASAAARVEHGTYVELRGSHFIQMEQPEVVHQLLLDFLDQVG